MATDYRYNHPDKKDLRKKLRNDTPKAERILWSQLQGRQIQNLKFRRQYGIGPYVVDFFCPQLRLTVEVDGDSHFQKNAEKYDKKRQKYIEKHNICFLRFTNEDVYKNLDGVIEEIVMWTEEKGWEENYRKENGGSPGWMKEK